MRLRLLAAVPLLALVACAGSEGDITASGTPSPSAAPSVSLPSCPPAPATSPSFPAEVPAIVPRPEGVTLDKVLHSQSNNVTTVRFYWPRSLTESVIFVVREYPKAGFALGRGDAEATEADAPFQRGDALRGLVRMYAVEQCKTLWSLSVVRNLNAPYNLSYSPKPSSTPLPFG